MYSYKVGFRYFLVVLAFLFSASCSTKEKSTYEQRELSSDQTLEEEHDREFVALFERFLADTEGELEIVKPFASTSLRILKRSYHYLERFDAELDRIHKDCKAQRRMRAEAVCESPMDLPGYLKMQASRIVLERQKDKLAYFYQRLLDIGNSQDDNLQTAFAETDVYLGGLDAAAKSDRAMAARGVLTQWNTELRDLIQVSGSQEGPIAYELAVDLFKVKERAHRDWAELSGASFVVSSLLKNAPDVTSDFEKRGAALAREKAEGASFADSAELTKVYNQLQEVERSPQAIAWKNHTGKSFKRGEWAITYDDGPKSSTTNQILDTLASREWHATFFWLAKNVKSKGNARVVERTKRMGMGLAHHSYSHANLGKSNANIRREIREAKSVLESVYGRRLNYFRLPYGSGRKLSRIQNMVTSLDMEHFFWNVDSLDWKKSSPAQIYRRTKKQMDVQGRGILLFHDIHQRTVDTTKILARELPGLNVIPLENGGGILSKANSAERNPVPKREPFSPHTRTITASILNVRVAGAGTRACGEFHRGDVVRVLSQNAAGWFEVRIAAGSPRPKAGNARHTCSGKGWISDGYSSKN